MRHRRASRESPWTDLWRPPPGHNSAFAALDRHDLPQFMSAWRDDGVFIYPGEIPESGTFTGRSAVEGWFRFIFDMGDNFRRNWSAPR